MRQDTTSRLTTITIEDGRTFGVGTYGDRDGSPVLYCHGTPGSALEGVLLDRAAAAAGILLIVVERPGMGVSPLVDDPLGAWPGIATEVLGRLGHDRFGVLGFSGGGPFALALAADAAEHVNAVAIAAGFPPADGVDRDVLRWYHRAYFRMADHAAWLLPLPIAVIYFGVRFTPALWYRVMQRLAQPVDKMLMADPPVREALLAKYARAFQGSLHGVVQEARKLGEPWPFDPADTSAPVAFWHGDGDTTAPIAGVERLAQRIPQAELTVLASRAHMWLFDDAEPVLHWLASRAD